MRYESRARARKGAVSLIEILVALAIITILVSLSAAAIHRVRLNGMIRTTETTVGRLQMGVDKQVTIVSDEVRTKDRQGRSQDFATLVAMCNGDEDRAAALLLYCRLRQTFPMHDEIGSLMGNGRPGFTLTLINPASTSNPPATLSVNFPYSPAFAALAPLAGGNENQVTAAILYVGLSQRTQGGNTFAADEGTAKQLTLGLAGNPRAFGDAWDNPVGFRRFESPAGLAGGASGDPFDPKGKLQNWTGQYAAQNQATAAAVVRTSFNGQNKTILVYSLGPDGGRPTQTADDDIQGHRLRSVGDRGTKP